MIGHRLHSFRTRTANARPASSRYWNRLKQHAKEDKMPYLLGWLLGVPVIVLVILYLIFH
ncbi:hypothetical protein AWB77_04190 [Caballeronia fortuita]|uniref:Uncharacterized protein n=1 Tax=Caballeronia fortuita TaxID=1777138 RepID=A0A158CJ45_9BURK|nr:hypothetical protein AWB77_04190 [Caballeronia fortuita]